METPQTRDMVAAAVIGIIHAYPLGISDKEISEQANLVKDLGASSLDLVEFQMILEDTFKTEPLSRSEETSLRTVGDVIDILWSRVRDGKAACPQK